jgi:hypothetical protein
MSRKKIAQALADQWFGKSIVKDAEGNPLRVFRGEHGDPADLAPGQVFQNKVGGITFGDAETASTYAMDPNDYRMKPVAPRVTPGHLRIENPIIHATDDPYIELGHLADKLGEDEAHRIARKFDSHIQNTGNWEENYYGKYDNVDHLLKENPSELRKLYFMTYPYLDDAEEVAKLQARGYDGAAHIGSGENAGEMEYRIFDPSQFRTSIKGLAAAPIGAGAMGSAFDQSQYEVPP